MKFSLFFFIKLLALISYPCLQAQPEQDSILLFQIAVNEKVELEPELKQTIHNCLQELFSFAGNAKLEISANAYLEKEVLIVFESLKKFINSENKEDKTAQIIAHTDLKQLLLHSVLIMPVLVENSLSEIEEKSDGQNKFVLNKKRIIIDLYGIKVKAEPILIKRRISALGLKTERETALQDALLALKRLLAFEVGYFVEKGFRERVIKVANDQVYLSCGAKEGTVLGTEYEIYTDENKDGQNLKRIKGLVIVNEVTDLVSQASLLFSNEQLFPADKVKKIERFGLELTTYLTAIIPWRLEGEYLATSGIRVILARALFNVRPILYLETIIYPFSIFDTQIILRFFSGIELTTYLGILQLSAEALFGLEKDFYYNSQASPLLFSLRGMVNFSLLLTRDLKFVLLSGYEYWFGTRQGFILGAGLTLKI